MSLTVPSDEADSGDSDDPLLLLILSIDFVVVTIVLVGSEVFVIRIFPPEVVEVLRDLFASTPVVERSTTDRARGLSTLLLVCESAITILGSVDVCAEASPELETSFSRVVGRRTVTEVKRMWVGCGD
jgi:hypothetical protein